MTGYDDRRYGRNRKNAKRVGKIAIKTPWILDPWNPWILFSTIVDVQEIREYYFGGVDQYRMVLERGGRGIKLQASQESKPLNYLMYPYAEINGKALDYFDPENFRYSVHFKQL